MPGRILHFWVFFQAFFLHKALQYYYNYVTILCVISQGGVCILVVIMNRGQHVLLILNQIAEVVLLPLFKRVCKHLARGKYGCGLDHRSIWSIKLYPVCGKRKELTNGVYQKKTVIGRFDDFCGTDACSASDAGESIGGYAQ